MSSHKKSILDEPIGNRATKTKPKNANDNKILDQPFKQPSKFKPMPEHEGPGVFGSFTRLFRRRPTRGGRKQKTRKNKGRKTQKK